MDSHPVPQSRRVAFIAGAGRSGTSTMAGLLRILGMHVPQPEVVADQTNPKGFGEPEWVVRTHGRMLDRVNVQVADARPRARELVEDLAEDRAAQELLTRWLGENLAVSPSLVVKDPRLTWFLPMWRAAAVANRAMPGFVTPLRSPAEVIGSRRAYYEPERSPAHLAAGWLNAMLHTERGTRPEGSGDRAFVSYDLMLEDWRAAVERVDHCLGLGLDLAPERLAAADEFVDPTLRRVTPELRDLELPVALRELVEEAWVELNRLTEPGGDTPEVRERLDHLRGAYDDTYRAAEELSTSSTIAARRQVRQSRRSKQHRGPVPTVGGPPTEYQPHPGWRPTANWIPHRVRAAIPGSVRRRIRKALRIAR